MSTIKRIFAAAAIATAGCLVVSGLIVHAPERAFRSGREAGQCDIIVALDKAMRRNDPTWGPPRPIIKKCAAQEAKRGAT